MKDAQMETHYSFQVILPYVTGATKIISGAGKTRLRIPLKDGDTLAISF